MQTFTPYEYVKIDIANNFGLDKLNWEDRIDWVDGHRKDLHKLTPDAEEPLLFAKGTQALLDAENHRATGFIMGLDATASGLQIMTALTGCYESAKRVNLVNTGKREDAYQSFAQVMSQVTGQKFDKATLKKPIMTTFYGSKKQPEQIFGKGTPELRAFYESLEKAFPGPYEMLEVVQQCWQPDALKHEWTLPDGHVASIKVMDMIDKKIEVDELNHATFTYRTEVNQPVAKGISLIANIVHSVDGWIVREMIRRANKQGFDNLTIHDSFWSCPNYVQFMRYNYRDIFCDLAKSNLLSSILGEITGVKDTWIKKSNNLDQYIAKSEYAIC